MAKDATGDVSANETQPLGPLFDAATKKKVTAADLNDHFQKARKDSDFVTFYLNQSGQMFQIGNQSFLNGLLEIAKQILLLGDSDSAATLDGWNKYRPIQITSEMLASNKTGLDGAEAAESFDSAAKPQTEETLETSSKTPARTHNVEQRTPS